MSVDVSALAARLRHFESVILMTSASSTNGIGRRVLLECLENELALPRAIIVAREQTAGRGRGSRTWHSPAGRGIWATALVTRPLKTLPLFPLEAAIAVAGFLQNEHELEARIKWPNDIYVGNHKIAGILTEARARESEAFLIVGFGINVLPLGADSPPEATSIAQQRDRILDLDQVTEALIEHIDRELFRDDSAEEIIERWRQLTLHREGDRVRFAFGDQQISGYWMGIDAMGRALIETAEGIRPFAAGEMIAIDDSSS